MTNTPPGPEVADALRPILKSQYHAALAMLKDAVEQCPEDLWSATDHHHAFWQLAYHTLFYTHLYLHSSEAAFRPWIGHQAHVQSPSALTGAADPNSPLPPLPTQYSKVEVLAYWNVCDGFVNEAMDAMDLSAPECGFWWYRVSKLEHQLINIRHVQHHAAQLIDRLRSSADVHTEWVGWRH